jgi:phenylacetate-coenzyme A ligase PaaK-like adenylate-forming protein
MDSDESVEKGETGRLIFTSLSRKGQDLFRYEIGDLGRWVDEPCDCGRKSPRFELLGRFGDIFKMGPLFNYSEFEGILDSKMTYGGDLQLLLEITDTDKQKIIIRINKSAGLESENVRECILDNYPMLAQMVRDDDLIVLDIEQREAEDFEKIASSGKLHKIIDNRKLDA